MQFATAAIRRRVSGLALLAACMTVLAGVRADERAFRFSTFEVDGASFTEAWAINPSGTIVGIYGRTGVGARGFVLEEGVISTIEYPAAPGGPAVVYTDARGINAAGDIVGMYRLAGEGGTVMHGYLLTKGGEFVPIDVPGRMGTVPVGILPDGTIVGCSHDTNMTTTMFAFVRDPSGAFTDYPVPGTMHYGATPDLAQIAGRYAVPSASGVQHYGYVLDETGLNLFRVPGTAATQAWGINPRGEIVGFSWSGGAATYRGFVKEGDTFTTVHYPDAVATLAYGINPGGDVVGTYSDGVKYRAFLASRTARHNR